MTAIDYIILVLLLAVLGVLLAGVWQMMRGGNPRLSNKLMVWRVALQALVILLAGVGSLWWIRLRSESPRPGTASTTAAADQTAAAPAAGAGSGSGSAATPEQPMAPTGGLGQGGVNPAGNGSGNATPVPSPRG